VLEAPVWLITNCFSEIEVFPRLQCGCSCKRVVGGRTDSAEQPFHTTSIANKTPQGAALKTQMKYG